MKTVGQTSNDLAISHFRKCTKQNEIIFNEVWGEFAWRREKLGNILYRRKKVGNSIMETWQSGREVRGCCEHWTSPRGQITSGQTFPLSLKPVILAFKNKLSTKFEPLVRVLTSVVIFSLCTLDSTVKFQDCWWFIFINFVLRRDPWRLILTWVYHKMKFTKPLYKSDEILLE